jgi:hypothetical protein
MDLKYSLYGVLVHAGWNTQHGHYYCFVRTSSGLWHNLDDNQVTRFFNLLNPCVCNNEKGEKSSAAFIMSSNKWQLMHLCFLFHSPLHTIVNHICTDFLRKNAKLHYGVHKLQW